METGASPTAEVCDGLDNDCDGDVDEELYLPCYTGSPGTLGLGACSRGLRPCGSTACYFERLPEPEICDGVDNDCDGVVDEGLTLIPGCCEPPGSEVCDGLDNDCDGEIDEGVSLECSGARYCPGLSPEEVPCNGVDDDCDGTTDEGSGPPVEVAVAVDVSGSNAAELWRQKSDLQGAVLDFGALATCARFTVGRFGSDDRPSLVILAEDVDAVVGANALASLSGAPGWQEPSYDVLVELAVPSVAGAARSIILVADEGGQSEHGRTAVEVAATLGLYEVQALTFSALPWDYSLFGPTAALNADLRSIAFSFLRDRLP